MKNFFKSKKITITGSKGFIASHVIDLLREYKIKKLKLLNSKNVNYNNVQDIVKKIKGYDFVIHLTSATGGIKYTKDNITYQFYNSLIKDLNVFIFLIRFINHCCIHNNNIGICIYVKVLFSI